MCVCVRQCVNCTNLALLFILLAAVVVHSLLGEELALKLFWGFFLGMGLVVKVLLQLSRKRE